MRVYSSLRARLVSVEVLRGVALVGRRGEHLPHAIAGVDRFLTWPTRVGGGTRPARSRPCGYLVTPANMGTLAVTSDGLFVPSS